MCVYNVGRDIFNSSNSTREYVEKFGFSHYVFKVDFSQLIITVPESGDVTLCRDFYIDD